MRSLTLAAALQVLYSGKAGAENHADYRYESYLEEAGRISVYTHAFLFEQTLLSQLSLKGQYVHDALSGASPTGAPPPLGSSHVPTEHMEDARNAGFLEVGVHLGRHTTTPQVSYSLENDYESIGLSLTHAIEFNQRNTIASLGYCRCSAAKGQQCFRLLRWNQPPVRPRFVGIQRHLRGT